MLSQMWGKRKFFEWGDKYDVGQEKDESYSRKNLSFAQNPRIK